MRPNTTLRQIRGGDAAVGTWLQLHSVHATRLLVAQGFFRWMLVDFEHTPVDHTTAAHIFSTVSDLSAGHITPLARVAAGSVYQIKQALDAGAQGVIAPMIETADDAREVVRASRFPPDGIRGGGGLAPHIGFAAGRASYLDGVNSEILVAVQVETVEGVRNVDEIVDVPGIDLVFVGPNDLHLSLGRPARFWSDDPDFLAAVAKVLKSCTRAGVPVGTLCRDARNVAARIDDGFTFLGLGSDAHFLLTSAGAQYGELFGLAEPAETWCNSVNLDRLPDSLEGRPCDS